MPYDWDRQIEISLWIERYLMNTDNKGNKGHDEGFDQKVSHCERTFKF